MSVIKRIVEETDFVTATSRYEMFGHCEKGVKSGCHECRLAYHKDYYWKNREEQRARMLAYQKANKAKLLENRKKKGREDRLAALRHYSGGDPQCACCGEVKLEFLCIDHTNGGGNIHRRKHKLNGEIGPWLRLNGYPEGFRVLCHNCNFAASHYGYCPHNSGIFFPKPMLGKKAVA